jgi:hypothetical protein
MWLDDFEVLPEETIDFSPEFIRKAVELSLNIPNEERQWQTYLNVLALYSFEEWLGVRAPDVTINQEHCSVQEPPVANAIEVVCNLKVNEFNFA